MQSSQTKDKDLGIALSSWGLGDSKFREVRQKAAEERQELRHRAKKDKEVKVPQFGPGDRVVIVTGGYKTRGYILVEVVDFIHPHRFDWLHPYEYFGIVLKTTSKDDLHRLGRLTTFTESRQFAGKSPANVDEGAIRWLDLEEKT